MMKFKNEAGLVNFVCIVFELGDKMLTLSSMENLIVQYNHINASKQTTLLASVEVAPQKCAIWIT